MNKNYDLSNTIEINGRCIGPGYPPYVVAELSGNHQGNINKALRLIEEAANAGADAIKIQTYRPDTITINHNGPEFKIKEGLWQGKTLYDLYEEAHTPWQWHDELFKKAKELNITLFSSPFDTTAIDLLESLHCPAYKIASYEIVDLGLIEKAIRTNKPVIISTGLATHAEIKEAVKTVQAHGGREIALLHCISGYPTPIDDCHLKTIVDLAKNFSCPIGLSDHTTDTVAAIAATALGASIIEKHFTLDKKDRAIDAAFSLDVKQFAELVNNIRRAYKAIGNINYAVKKSEQGGRAFRRSLYVTKDIAKGEAFTVNNIRSIRPGLGIHPRYFKEILEKSAKKDIAYGTPLTTDLIENFIEK